ncbi:MAG: hypothetical protein ACJ8CB_15285 [Ktedonobacteraceae bacterium]
MQDMITGRHSLTITTIVVLLNIQAILGVFFGLSVMVRLLAPGSPIIISGAAIFAGPVGGAPLVVALASPIIAWGLWMAKPWARFRTMLLEIISLGIGAFELVFELAKPDLTRGVCLALVGVAALILLCLYAGPGIRALSRA